MRFDGAHEVEDPNGPCIRYHATFGRGAYGWESATYQWKFFYKIEDAKARLAKKLRERAEDNRREASRWDALAATFEATSGAR